MHLGWWKNRSLRTVAIIIAGYLAIGWTVLPLYQWQINPDGLAYLDVARAYLRLDWPQAINAYWGPLFSWLLVPFLAGGLEPLVVPKVLNLLIGGGVLGMAAYLLRGVRPAWLNAAALGVLAIVVLDWALASYITPDLLMVLVLLAYAATCLRPGYFDQRHWALLAGGIAGLGFLTKSYALPFFLVQALGWYGWQAWRNPQSRRATWRHLGWFLLPFGLMVIAWSGVLSIATGHLTTGTSGAYNLALVGPQVYGHPMEFEGLFKPAPHANSAWANPSVFQITTWRPWDDVAALKHTWHLVNKNWGDTLGLVGRFSALALAIALGALLFATHRSNRRTAWSQFVVWCWWTGAIYTAGYVLVFTEDRYLWPINVLVLLTGTIVLAELWNQRNHPRWLLVALVGLTAWSMYNPAFIHLKERRNVGIEFSALAQNLKLQDLGCTSLASNINWNQALFTAYHAKCPYYGVFAPGMPELTRAQLAKFSVSHVLVWEDPAGNRQQLAEALADYQEIPVNNRENIRIFARR